MGWGGGVGCACQSEGAVGLVHARKERAAVRHTDSRSRTHGTGRRLVELGPDLPVTVCLAIKISEWRGAVTEKEKELARHEGQQWKGV